MNPSTDVSSAQSFDVSSFLNNLVNTAGNVITGQRTAPSQNTGQPGVTPTPNLRAGGNTSATAGGFALTQTQLLLIGGAVLAALLLMRRR